MPDAEIMDLTVVSTNFPELIGPTIPRDNIHDTIETIFDGSTQLVVVEGVEGIGKTTVLAQFVQRHPKNAISLFIEPTSRWAYDPGSALLDICNQINWILRRKELETTEGVNEAFLRASKFELQRLARRNREVFYFVIDGLDQIPKQESHNLAIILDMLPIGGKGLRFLFSGDPNEILERANRNVPYKSHVLSGFTLDETVRYLSDMHLSSLVVEEVYKICRGNPGHLSSVRRIFQSGIDVQEFLDEMPKKLPELFEIEWRAVDSRNELQLQLLALIAHDSRKHSMTDLSRLLTVEISTAEELIRPLGFVSIDSNEEVHFVTETFRQFAASQLHVWKSRVNDILIDDLLRKPESDVALRYLPGYFEEAGRNDDALRYLSADNFSKILEHSQSIVPAQQKAELGVRLSRKERRDGDLLRFSLHRTTLAELRGVDIWRSEIAARMAVKDYKTALILAESPVLKEDQLHLLAVVAKITRNQGLPLEPELIEQIRHLHEQINWTDLGDRSIEIASDLLYSVPELAVETIKKANTADKGDNSLDWAFAVLSNRITKSDDAQSRSPGIFTSIQSKVKDPDMQNFLSATAILVTRWSASHIINEITRMQGASNQLYLLCVWCLVNKEHEDAVEVIEHALKLIVQTVGYSPNARVLRELATPLPYIEDLSRLKYLIRLFDAQVGTIQDRSPSEEYIGIQLLLAEAEIHYDGESARSRMIDIYLHIIDLDDLAVKSACMARLVSSLAILDPKMTFEVRDHMHSLSLNDLETDMQKLLDMTADHYDATRGAIQSLARTKPDMALKWILKLNLEHRKDRALLDLVDECCSMAVEQLDLVFLEKVVASFVNFSLRDQALLRILSQLAEVSNVDESLIINASPLINRVSSIQDTGERCSACCLAYGLLKKHDSDKYEGFRSSLLNQLDDSWRNITTGWKKIDHGFKISESLANYAPAVAMSYLDLTQTYRDETPLDSRNSALAYSSGVVLAIRAFSGLLKRKLDTEDDLSRLGTLIEHMPSHGERALLWSELALCFYNKGRSDTCKEIVNRRIKPLLENISAKDISYRSDVIILLAPALYCAHKTIALEIISTLPPVPQPDRDEAYAQICRFVVTKHSPLDPFEWLPGQNFNISYEEMVDICDILHLIDDDWSISSIMEAIVCSIRSRHNNTRYSSQQKADITTRLQNIVNNDLPNKGHLPHEGFRIISQAQVNSIQQLPVSKWQDLIKEARDISNIADRALILCLIAAYMPPKYGALQQEILEEARTAIEHIPVDLEKIEHYDILANRTLDINPSLSRDALKSAWLLATQNDNLNVRTARRRIIDLAHRLDPNLANTFASSMDDDPARAEARLQLKQQLQVLDLKKKMIAPDQSNSGAVSDKSIYSSAAYVLLRSLNAGMIQHVPIENTREYIQIASTLPFSESFPIFAWVIQNAVVRYESTDQAKVILRGLYEAVTANIGLTRQVAARSSIHVEQSIRHVTGSLDRTSIVIHPGERDTAINYLQDWIGKNVQGYLKIADQFFGLDDLEVLKLVLFANPTCRVEILTSRKHQTQEKVPQPWEDSYQTHWRIRILDQDPPETDVVIVGIASTGESPVHDRWWLTDGGGLRIGTSFNSLGVGKASEISILSEGEAELRQNEVDQYLKRITREHNGERLSYVSFNL